MEQNNKKELVETANRLLSLVKQENKGLGIIVDVLEEQQLEELRDWFDCVKVYIDKHGTVSQKEDLESLRWIINHNRVNVERIQKIIRLIETIELN